jgi:hypothetical protein
MSSAGFILIGLEIPDRSKVLSVLLFFLDKKKQQKNQGFGWPLI